MVTSGYGDIVVWCTFHFETFPNEHDEIAEHDLSPSNISGENDDEMLWFLQ